MTIEEKIRRCLARHVEWEDVRIANSVGCRVSDVKVMRDATPLIDAESQGPGDKAAKPEAGGGGLISLQSLVAKYDTRAAILHEIASLPRGKGITEAELCRRVCGTDRFRFNRTVQNCSKELTPLRLKIRLPDQPADSEKVWFWAKPADIAALKKAVDPWAA